METPKLPKQLYTQASQALSPYKPNVMYHKVRERIQERRHRHASDEETIYTMDSDASSQSGELEGTAPELAPSTKMEDVEMLGDGTIIGVVDNQKVMLQTTLDTGGLAYLEE